MRGLILLMMAAGMVGCSGRTTYQRTNWDYHHEHPECRAAFRRDDTFYIEDGERHYLPSWTHYDCPDGTDFDVYDSEAAGRP
jgi:hypothetical protein